MADRRRSVEAVVNELWQLLMLIMLNMMMKKIMVVMRR